MKLEKQVTSLEISKRLKELGVKQESFFHWCGLKNYNIQYGDFSYMGDVISAFTVAELGEMLLPEVDSGKTNEGSPAYVKGGKWISCLMHKSGERISHRVYGETEADARGKMLIYLIENKLIML